MSEKYELSNPYQPLGPPSQAYRDGWDRVFGKKPNDSADLAGGAAPTCPDGGAAPTRVGYSGGVVDAAGPRVTLDAGKTANSYDANGGHERGCPGRAGAGACDCGGPTEPPDLSGCRAGAPFIFDAPADPDACPRCGDVDRPCACVRVARELPPDHPCPGDLGSVPLS